MRVFGEAACVYRYALNSQVTQAEALRGRPQLPIEDWKVGDHGPQACLRSDARSTADCTTLWGPTLPLFIAGCSEMVSTVNFILLISSRSQAHLGGAQPSSLCNYSINDTALEVRQRVGWKMPCSILSIISLACMTDTSTTGWICVAHPPRKSHVVLVQPACAAVAAVVFPSTTRRSRREGEQPGRCPPSIWSLISGHDNVRAFTSASVRGPSTPTAVSQSVHPDDLPCLASVAVSGGYADDTFFMVNSESVMMLRVDGQVHDAKVMRIT